MGLLNVASPVIGFTNAVPASNVDMTVLIVGIFFGLQQQRFHAASNLFTLTSKTFKKNRYTQWAKKRILSAATTTTKHRHDQLACSQCGDSLKNSPVQAVTPTMAMALLSKLCKLNRRSLRVSSSSRYGCPRSFKKKARAKTNTMMWT